MFIARRLRALSALAGFCAFAAACGVADDEATPTESAETTVAQYHAEGDYTCADGTPVHIAQSVTMGYQRLAAGLPSRFQPHFIGDGSTWAVDYTRVLVMLNCSYAIPTSPTCTAAGGLCSTGPALCAVFARPRGWSNWQYSGYTSAGVLTFTPGPTFGHGTFSVKVSQDVALGSGDGYGVKGCGAAGGQILFSFAG